MYTVGNVKDSIAGLLSGTDLDKVTNLNGALERAARKLVQKADIPEATEVTALTLYDNVFDYLAPTKIFGGALIDLYPQGVDRTYSEDSTKLPIQLFDRSKHYLPSGNKVTFKWDKGVPIVSVSSSRPDASVTIDPMNNDDDWTVGGSLSGLAEDATVFYESPKSLRFLLTGSDTGTLTKTLSSALNLSTYEDVAVGFLAIRIPDGATASNLTSVAVRLGSSASAYDEVSNTEGFLGSFVAGKWLLVALDFSTATPTGTPDWTALDYLQVRIAHTGTFTNFRVGGFFLSLPSPHEMLYQTPALFLNDGALSLTITDNDDQIILNDSAYILYEHEAALTIAIQNKQKEQAKEMRAILYGGEGDIGLYAQYRADNPSQELRTIGRYYDI